ncbi:MAG: Serine/threonine-protein kinase StkP [Chlamydiae bacterium]|nr:Serine/threonine-protein kinase StkP [Chlamydiota bacterium]
MSAGALVLNPIGHRRVFSESSIPREKIAVELGKIQQKKIGVSQELRASSFSIAGQPKKIAKAIPVKDKLSVHQLIFRIMNQKKHLFACGKTLNILKEKAKSSEDNEEISKEFFSKVNTEIDNLQGQVEDIIKRLNHVDAATMNKKSLAEISRQFGKIQVETKNLPERLEKERILEIFEQKIGDTSDDIRLRISGKNYRELSVNYIVVREEKTIRILRQFHKADKTTWDGRTICGKKDKGFIGKGAIKKAYELMDIDTKQLRDVRSVPRDKKEGLREGVIEASKALQGKPHVHTGHVVTYEKTMKNKSGDEVKVSRQFLLSPRRDTDLFELLFTKKLNDKAKVKAMKQMAKGLQATHEAGIAHLDVKPDNCLANYTPDKPDEIDIFLDDFDMAMTLSPADKIPMGGSPEYMAPEIFHEKACGLEDGKKADIYSLGMSFWAIDTLYMPEFNLRYGCLAPPKSSEALISRGFPKEEDQTPIQSLIFKMINPNNTQRPSIEEVIRELDKIYPE